MKVELRCSYESTLFARELESDHVPRIGDQVDISGWPHEVISAHWDAELQRVMLVTTPAYPMQDFAVTWLSRLAQNGFVDVTPGHMPAP